MNIFLDGHRFELEPDTGVLRTPLVEWPQNTRLDGQQRRKDRSLLSSYVIDDWSGGLGIERQNVENPNHTTRLWDAENVDTRFPSQIVLSPAFNFATIVPSRGDLNLAFIFDNNLQFCETTATTRGGFAYRFSAPFTIGSYYQLVTGSNSGVHFGSVAGIGVANNRIGILCRGSMGAGNQDLFISVGSIGGNELAWSERGQQNNIRLAQFSDLGGTPHSIDYGSDGRVYFNVYGQDFLSRTLLTTAIRTSVGSYLAPLVNDGLKMYAYLPEGIYDFDITPSVIISTDRSKDQNANQVMFKNELYFKNAKSLIYYDGVDLKSIGYDLEDGLPSDKAGEITAMTSNFKWIYAAVKGATYSHILTRDQGGNWQYYARIPSAGLWVREMFLSNSPDAIDRLWCLFDNYAYPGYFLNPVVNPLQAGTYSFSSDGYFTKPVFDGGLPEVDGVFLDIGLTSKAMGGSNSSSIFYGLNGASPTTSLLGNISTTFGNIIFGSPYGVQGRRIQSRFWLTNGLGNMGTTPVFQDALFHYLKDPDKRETFDFTIDVRETARYAGLPQEAIIGTLGAIMDTKTLLPFYYGLVATRQVKVLDIPAQEDIIKDDILGGERSASIKMRVAEIL